MLAEADGLMLFASNYLPATFGYDAATFSSANFHNNLQLTNQNILLLRASVDTATTISSHKTMFTQWQEQFQSSPSSTLFSPGNRSPTPGSWTKSCHKQLWVSLFIWGRGSSCCFGREFHWFGPGSVVQPDQKDGRSRQVRYINP